MIFLWVWFWLNLYYVGFPAHWVDHAIPYGQLKKCLKKVQRELQDLGLEPETLRALIHPDSDSPLALQYRLKSRKIWSRPLCCYY